MSQLKFNKKKWLKNKDIKHSHNCYAYFLNKINKNNIRRCKKSKKHSHCLTSKPGLYKHYKTFDYKKHTNCKSLLNRTIKDNKAIFKVKENTPCPKNYYKGALVVNNGKDYHYYRQDSNKRWSHKLGSYNPTIYDSNKKIINNPRLSSRTWKKNKYPTFCNYFCVPMNAKKKHHKLPRSKKNVYNFNI